MNYEFDSKEHIYAHKKILYDSINYAKNPYEQMCISAVYVTLHESIFTCNICAKFKLSYKLIVSDKKKI
jgi:hypothetical protein